MSSVELVYLDWAECKVISVNTVVVYKNLHLFIVQKEKRISNTIWYFTTAAHSLTVVGVKPASPVPAIMLPLTCWQDYVHVFTAWLYGLECNLVNGNKLFCVLLFELLCIQQFVCVCVLPSLFPLLSSSSPTHRSANTIKRFHFSILRGNSLFSCPS